MNTKVDPHSQNNEIAMVQAWPTTFFVGKWQDHAQEVGSIVDYLYELKSGARSNIDSGVAPKAKSDSGLFESHFDLFDLPHPGLGKLKTFLVDSVRQIVIQVNRHQLPKKAIDVEIADGWFHITNDGGFHDAHGHQHCSWCGIYYLQLGDSGRQRNKGAPNGGNRFYSPFNIGGHYIDAGNQYLNQAYLDPPIEEGMLLLFPSYLQHSALPYQGRQDRIVIAFNSRSSVIAD